MRLLSLNYESALGSAVHATPVFAALRRHRPEWEIHVATRGLAAKVLRNNPGISCMHVTADPVHQPLKAALDFWRLRRRHRFDAVLVNSGNRRGRIACHARLVRTRFRIGVGVSRRWVDLSLPVQERESVAANNLQVLRPLIAEPPEPIASERFEIFWGSAESAEAAEFRRRAEGSPLVGLVTHTSGGQPSRWFDDRFVAVGRALQERIGARLVFFGTSGEAEKIRSLSSQLGPHSISLAGRTELSQLAAHCAACDLVVTVDTGTMHIGRAVGVPMVVVAAAWQPAWEWLPIGQDHIRVVRRSDIGCRHCRKVHCATHECMDEISAVEVLETALEHLSKYPVEDTAAFSRLRRGDGSGHRQLP